jgi:hypothetical protein
VKRVAVVVVLVAVSAVAVLGGSTASGAPERPSVDIYMGGRVIKRVPGKNVAVVEIFWDYKCFGDKLGDSTYEWTLKVLRRQPKPVKTMTLGTGTTKRGSMRTQLGPGSYLPTADPFLCETERGAGNDQPEIGAPFTVPDFCAWSVTASRGAVELEQGAAVKLAKPGSTVRPGESIVTPRGGSASLESNGNDGTATVGAFSSIGVDAKQCAGKGVWKLRLARGAASIAVPGVADPKRSYQTDTANATASGSRGARWKLQFTPGKPTTRVTVTAGSVVVTGNRGSAVTVKAGSSTVVVGAAAPSKPSR